MRNVFIVVLALTLPAQAQIYKWYDEQGRARYGEKPPPGVSARQLSGPPAEAPPPSRESVAEREARERAAKAEKIRREQCERLREELAVSESVPLFRWDRGEKVYFSEAQQKAHATKVRALIDEHCR